MTKIPNTQNNKKAKILMFDITLPQANFWYDVANIALIFGAFFVLAGTWGAIRMGYIKERFSDERITKNEADTAIANENTAKAKLEIERLRESMAWRRLSEEQTKSLVTSLKGTSLNIKVCKLLS